MSTFKPMTKAKAKKVSSIWRDALDRAPSGVDHIAYANKRTRHYFRNTVSPENLDKLILSFNRNLYGKFETATQEVKRMFNGGMPLEAKQAQFFVTIKYKSSGILPS